MCLQQRRRRDMSLLQKKKPPNGFVCLPWNKQALRSVCVKKGNDLQMGLMHSE